MAANSGEISMFASPTMPYAPNRDRAHFSPQMREEERTAPSSTTLWGHTLTFALTTASVPMTQWSLITARSARNAPLRTCASLPTMFSWIRAPFPTETRGQSTEDWITAPSSMTHPSPATTFFRVTPAPTTQSLPSRTFSSSAV